MPSRDEFELFLAAIAAVLLWLLIMVEATSFLACINTDHEVYECRSVTGESVAGTLRDFVEGK